jgi:hypothetical protein
MTEFSEDRCHFDQRDEHILMTVDCAPHCHFDERDERKFITMNCARRNLLDGRFLAPLEMTGGGLK